MATAKPITDHDQIRKWVEARNGRPARVKATGRGKDPGILRIDFPGFSGEDSLEEIGWDEFFEWFDRNNLAMLLSNERRNRFNKLVERTAGRAGSKKASVKRASTSTKKSSAKKSSAKKSSAKKSSAKKAAPAKRSLLSAGKKGGAKKSSAKKASAKKAGAKKTSAKKTSAKKAATARKATTKRAATTTKRSTAAGSKTTTNHDEIRRWVESRGGFPATVAGTESRGEEAGVLRIDYPGFSGKDTLERIDWDSWFQKFDEENLAFLYQDKRNSRFSKLVRR
jgi:hypothetical protein